MGTLSPSVTAVGSSLTMKSYKTFPVRKVSDDIIISSVKECSANSNDVLVKCKDALLQLTREKEELTMRKSELEGENQKLERAFIDLRTKCDSQENEFKNVVDNLVKSFEMKMKSKDSEAQSLQAAMKYLEGQHRDFKEKTHENIMENENEKNILKNDLIRTENKVNLFKSENEILKNDLEATESEVEDKNNQLLQFEETIKILEKNLSDSVQESSRYKSGLDDLL